MEDIISLFIFPMEKSPITTCGYSTSIFIHGGEQCVGQVQEMITNAVKIPNCIIFRVKDLMALKSNPKMSLKYRYEKFNAPATPQSLANEISIYTGKPVKFILVKGGNRFESGYSNDYEARQE